jgi:hypothetical protein
MKNKTNDELAELGWAYVARDHMREVAALTTGHGSDLKEQIMEWLGEGWTVSKLFE